MLCKHNEVKQKLKKMMKKQELRDFFDSLAMSEDERAVMDLHYCEKIQLKDIAKELGYSEPGVIRIHMRVLERIEPVLLADKSDS